VKGKGICSYFRAGLEWGRGRGRGFGERERKKKGRCNGYLRSGFFFFFLSSFPFSFWIFFGLEGRSARVRDASLFLWPSLRPGQLG
jgi:hypothetical protein